MTERRTRRIKPSMTYRMPPDIERKIDALVESGEFVNRAEAMSTLIRFALDYRQFDVKIAVQEFLVSEEGRELIHEIIKREKREK